MAAVAAVTVLALCIMFIPGTSAFADMGPKPSVRLTFINLDDDEECWCTLLSSEESSGPNWAWDGDETVFEYGDINREVFLAFANYCDNDGFYFLQVMAQCNQNKSFTWNYYPPETFKVLLYFPQTDTFVSSPVYQCYAFDSYYSINMARIDTSETFPGPLLSLKISYNYFGEILGLLARVVLTIAVELGVACLFRFRGKKVFLWILIVNIATQLLLNIVLNVTSYLYGDLFMFLVYFFAEFFVFLSEAVTFSVAFARIDDIKAPVWKSILYAFTANTLSFVVGIILALFIPILF